MPRTFPSTWAKATVPCVTSVAGTTSASAGGVLAYRVHCGIAETAGRRADLPHPRAGAMTAAPDGGGQRGWWRGLDLNQRRLSPTDLQSVPFSHSGTPPCGTARLGPTGAIVNECGAS